MPEIYESDRDEVEKLQKWWAENGRTTTVGLVLGLGGVFGWTAWQTHQTNRAEAASALYAQVVHAAAADRFEDVQNRADTLLAEYAGTGYAVLTTLYLAKAALVDGRRDEAMAHLTWVLDNASEPEYRLIARLRLARLALDADDTDRAWQLLAEENVGTDPAALAYEANLADLRGDVLVAQGRPEEARQAYQSALDGFGEASPEGLRLRLKLDALGNFTIPPGDA